MSGAPADPAAATVSPTDRTRTPPRAGLRVGRRSEPVQMHPEITGRIEEELEIVNPALQAAIAAVTAPVEEEPTDPGATPVPTLQPQPRPYANLDYEERVCRLLEDLLDNTRRVRLHLDAEQHLRDVAATSDLDLQPTAPKGLREVMRDCIVAWLLDPEVKRLALKVAVVGTTAGGSVAGGASTMMLAMELVERLLRAWVELP